MAPVKASKPAAARMARSKATAAKASAKAKKAPAKAGITLVKQSAKTASTRLDDWGPVGLPEGRKVSKLRGKRLIDPSKVKGPSMGVWECSPGKWRRQVKSAEFAHFVKGRAIFHADSGEAIEIEAGDAVYFPANTNGIWEILATARKNFILV
ncbi:MAG: DUF861 domain-containing protein [Rhodospirillaceae bacterium]|nr:DUF861 domain-containing protein [Rhodospirillaceae bacterium]